MDATTEREIIRRLTSERQREEGFRQLMNHFQEPLYRCIRQWVGQHEDANDVLQNTFIKVFRNIEQFRGDAALFSWMYRIAKNESYSFLRKKNKRPHPEELEPGHSVQSAQQPVMEEGELLEELRRAVESLPERQKQVFELRYYQAMKYSDMADLLKVSEGALKASFHHAVRKVEDWIREKIH